MTEGRGLPGRSSFHPVEAAPSEVMALGDVGTRKDQVVTTVQDQAPHLCLGLCLKLVFI